LQAGGVVDRSPSHSAVMAWQNFRFMGCAGVSFSSPRLCSQK